VGAKGIFFAPELHLAFECGKSITAERQNIWGQEKFEWKREVKFDNYGLADLYFKGENKGIVIEFKILQTIDTYIGDIEKLKKLDNEKYERFFCVILGFFENQETEHIDTLADKYGDEIELVFRGAKRETWPISYRKKLFYSTVIWKINKL
jgi:hypothetical protein